MTRSDVIAAFVLAFVSGCAVTGWCAARYYEYKFVVAIPDGCNFRIVSAKGHGAYICKSDSFEGERALCFSSEAGK